MKAGIFTLVIISVFLMSCGTASVRQPEYREIREVRLIELGLLQSTAGIDLVYYNPNKFGVQVTEARGDVYVDDIYLGRFGLEEKVQVPKKSEFVVPAVIRLDMIGALKNQRDILKKKEARVRIDGMARVRKAGISRDIPIHYEGMQNLEKLRTLIAP